MKKNVEETAVNAGPVVVTQEAALPVAQAHDSDFDGVEVESKDLVLAKVLLMQGISTAVAERKANIGDFLNSLTNEVIGVAGNKPLRILPFHVKKSYVVEKYNGSKYVYSHVVPDNADLPREFELNGTKYRNMHQYEFFCMLEGSSMPMVVNFRSTSHMAGKQLFNYMYLVQRAAKPQQPPFGNWIMLDGKSQKNDQGTFMVWTTSPDRTSTEEERNECRAWKAKVMTANVQSDPVEPTVDTSTVVNF